MDRLVLRRRQLPERDSRNKLVINWTWEPEMVTEEALVVKRSLGKDLNTHCVRLEMCRVFLAVRGWGNFPGETPQGEQLEMTHKESVDRECPETLPEATKEMHLW